MEQPGELKKEIEPLVTGLTSRCLLETQFFPKPFILLLTDYIPKISYLMMQRLTFPFPFVHHLSLGPVYFLGSAVVVRHLLSASRLDRQLKDK